MVPKLTLPARLQVVCFADRSRHTDVVMM